MYVLWGKKVNMSKKTGGAKESQDETAREKCAAHTCETFSIVTKIMRGEKGINVGKKELEHLNKHHYRTWADFGWACSAAYKDDNDRIAEENARLHSELNKIKAVNIGEPPVADPRNHVDGFCDVLITHPTGCVMKCTEYCKYGSNRCGLHQKAVHVLTK